MEEDREKTESQNEDDSAKPKQSKQSSDKTSKNVSDASDSSTGSRKSKSFRQATHHLREEALRRYRLKHQASWKDYSPPQSASKRKTKSNAERKSSRKSKDSEDDMTRDKAKIIPAVEKENGKDQGFDSNGQDAVAVPSTQLPQTSTDEKFDQSSSLDNVDKCDQSKPEEIERKSSSTGKIEPFIAKSKRTSEQQVDDAGSNKPESIEQPEKENMDVKSDVMDGEKFSPEIEDVAESHSAKSKSSRSSDDGTGSEIEKKIRGTSEDEIVGQAHIRDVIVSEKKNDVRDTEEKLVMSNLESKDDENTKQQETSNAGVEESSRFSPEEEHRPQTDIQPKIDVSDSKIEPKVPVGKQSKRKDELTDGRGGESEKPTKELYGEEMKSKTDTMRDLDDDSLKCDSKNDVQDSHLDRNLKQESLRSDLEEGSQGQQSSRADRGREFERRDMTDKREDQADSDVDRTEDDMNKESQSPELSVTIDEMSEETKDEMTTGDEIDIEVRSKTTDSDLEYAGGFNINAEHPSPISPAVVDVRATESPEISDEVNVNGTAADTMEETTEQTELTTDAAGDSNEVENQDTSEPQKDAEPQQEEEEGTTSQVESSGDNVNNNAGDTTEVKDEDGEQTQPETEPEAQPETETVVEAGATEANQQETEPDQQEAVPDQQETAPDQQEAVPDQQETVPDQQETVPDQQEPVPDQQEAVSDQQKTVPDQQEPVSDQQETVPDQQQTIPDQQETIPGQQEPGKEKETKDGEEKEADETGKVQPVKDAAATEDAVTTETEKTDTEKEKQTADDDGAGKTGDAADVEEEEEVGFKDIDDEENTMPDDFYYDKEDHMSKAIIAEESGLPNDMISLLHSFGYDCTKRSNLHLLDEKTIVFVAGNYVELIDLQTKEQSYIRSTSGGGIGAIAVHPSRQFMAVAEKGEAPNINIYEFPSLKLYRILRGGTEAAYAYVDFSPDGKLLASVGGDPDYMLTIWNWKQERIVLRSKAFSQDVFRVTFSTELEGQLTSSGTGHIRFWKMARTFTGLKLQGQLGKFGRTEISDIEGYVELPDGKVLSGSEWGNMLLWDGGLIKVEISRKNHKPCHHGAIQQIVMDEGELMTVGIDGCIRVWDFETIDTADVIDETGIFEMEPMNELQIGNGDVHLKSIVKSVDPDEPTMWYAQDANGGIWKLDLSFSHTSLQPEKILSYHAGAIRGCDTSPVSHLVATTGADFTVRVYDYTTHMQLCQSKYTSGGTALLWPPETVDPKGSSVIAGFEDGVVRVLRFQQKLNADLGKRSKDTSELVLFQAFKPHVNSVTAMAIDNSGDLLATGSDDCTVFFLTVGRQMEEFYDPIGFVSTPAPVTSLRWSPGNFDKNTLLVFMNDGQVMEIEAPEPGNFDTSKTYQITGLATRLYQFNSCKSQLRHDEEMARKKKEEEERLRLEEEERRKRKERGQLDSDDEDNEADEKKKKKKEKEEEWTPYIPDEPSAILHGFYSNDNNKFWVSMDGFDAGYLYECEFGSDKPIRAVPVTNSNDVAIQNIKFTNDRRQLLMGLKDGSIRVQSLSADDDITDLDTYWTLAMHDNHYGTIDQLALSFDNKFLFTVGHDGNFFTYSMMSQEELEEKIAAAKAKIPSARRPDEMKTTDDIDDPSAYSIEDAKQKAEHDRMMKLADLKKHDVRQTIAQLRHKFKKLLQLNDDLPTHLQLTRQEFEMDPEIKKDLERQTSEKVDVVRKELAWEAEKHRIALEKLKQKFKDIVECDRIVLKAFLTPHEACSYRAPKLSDDFYQLKAEMERRKTTMTTRDEMSRDPTSMLKGRRDAADGAERERSATQSDGQIKTTLKGSMGERINKALAKVEEKKRKRALRRSQWNELYEGKPDDDYEDPADVAAIKEAQENMGDYKLKTAPDYVVPDHLRMNAEKARNRLLILKDLIHHHKYEFNQQLLSLRDKKIRIIDEIKQLVEKLQIVQSKLPESEQKPVPRIPKMHPDELPEKKLEYTKDMLLKFKKDMEEKALQELKTGGGFGGNQFAAPKREATPASPMPLFRQQTTISAAADDNLDDDDEDADIGPSELEIQLQKVEQIKLTYERDSLLTRIDTLLKTFDAELRVLRHKKFKSEIDTKNADLRQVTLFEELVLLKEFEKSENVLADKMEGKQQEKLDMQAKVLECQQKIDNKRKDIERYQEKERSLHATFLTSLGENNKFAEYLTKVFKKKIKRTKKKATEGEDSEEESDEESDDESDWSDEDEESDEEAGGGLDLDVCPPGCDQSIYDSTCQLREKRLDIEEALTEEKKINEQLKRDLESLQRKAKIIDGALRTAEGDLEAFQLEKQQKLNELDVVVTLKLHQIQHIVNNAMPQDLTNCLVFESAGLIRLQHRIKELEHEKQLQKKQMKEAKRKHVELIKDRRLFEHRISEMDEQCNIMMTQKFGRIVDLEKLEQVTVNRNLEELKERLRQKEADCANEILKWEDKIGLKKDRITDLTRENTNRLEQLNMLLGEKKNYEGELDSRQKNLGGEYSGSRKADIHERQRLIQLVQLQAQEIEALKDEITLLSRKGGHILPPAQPPMPQSRTVSNINT